MSDTRLNNLILLLLLILMLVSFSFFNITPPFSSPSMASGLFGEEIPTAEAPVLVFRVIVEKIHGDVVERVSGAVVRVDELLRRTNERGVAQFLLTPGTYRVSVSSPDGRFPTWSEALQLTADQTDMRIKYVEYRQRIASIDITIDSLNGSSTILVGFEPIDAGPNRIAYAGLPVIVFYNEDFERRVFIGGRVYSPAEADEVGYSGVFTFSHPVAQAREAGIAYINDIVSAIVVSESYIPIFVVEATVVEMR
ncbi:MAG: hypothetical protein NXY59_08260 [Aigarchaeota archaeon]|nr:hypothetical protein [Candidatus Pelearchaeum maunauluense]